MEGETCVLSLPPVCLSSKMELYLSLPREEQTNQKMRNWWVTKDDIFQEVSSGRNESTVRDLTESEVNELTMTTTAA